MYSKLVHYGARTVGKRAIGILVECFFVGFVTVGESVSLDGAMETC